MSWYRERLLSSFVRSIMPLTLPLPRKRGERPGEGVLPL